jgi:predicted nucleic acid-binding protein
VSGILVDTNVLIDIITEDSEWFDWSSSTLENLANQHMLFINTVIYAEVSVSFAKIEQLEQALPAQLFRRSVIPWEAAFLAGKAFLNYRRKGGQRSAPLPNFFIGAHALIDQLTLLTRDGERFKHYFPRLQMICP